MKVTDNLDRHKILDEFKFWQNCFIQFGGTCPCMPKKVIFDFVWSIGWIGILTELLAL